VNVRTAFSHAGPAAWNALKAAAECLCAVMTDPAELKKQSKTYTLFYYSSSRAMSCDFFHACTALWNHIYVHLLTHNNI